LVIAPWATHASNRKLNHLSIDKTKASQGQAWFHKLGCASCHTISESGAASIAAFEAKPFNEIEIESNQGCLSDNPGISSAFYYLTTSERQAIAHSISQLEKLVTTTRCLAASAQDDDLNELLCLSCAR
jgi:hypothetical protein